jgi:hypothetical protein
MQSRTDIKLVERCELTHLFGPQKVIGFRCSVTDWKPPRLARFFEAGSRLPNEHRFHQLFSEICSVCEYLNDRPDRRIENCGSSVAEN